MHNLENIGFLRMVVLSKQPLYGQILVELEENSNDCKILLRGDIGPKCKFSWLYLFALKSYSNFMISIVFYCFGHL